VAFPPASAERTYAMNKKNVHISEPCDADWEGMEVEGARRFCGACTKHVHDLSSMTRGDALALLRSTPKLCVRYTCDENGDILHRPEAAPSVPRPALTRPRRIARLARAAARGLVGASLAVGAPAAASSAPAKPECAEEAGPSVFERLYDAFVEAVEEAVRPVGMGEVAVEPVQLEPVKPAVEPKRVTLMGKRAPPPARIEIEMMGDVAIDIEDLEKLREIED